MLTLRNSTWEMHSIPWQPRPHEASQRRGLHLKALYLKVLHLSLVFLLVVLGLLMSMQTAAARTRRAVRTHHVVRNPHRGCWVDIYAGADYAPPMRHIIGPISLPNLKLSDKNWGDAITSIRTGPRTWVRVYKDPGYRGEYLTIHPNSAHRSLRPLKFKDSIDSMIVRNHPF